MTPNASAHIVPDGEVPPSARAMIAELAAEHRKKDRDLERIADLRRRLRETRLAEHIRKVVDDLPPLTDWQRARLTVLLNDVGEEPHRG